MSNSLWPAIEELSFSGEVGLGNCSSGTVYRWARNINDYLEREKAVWRVKADAKNKTLKSVPLDQYVRGGQKKPKILYLVRHFRDDLEVGDYGVDQRYLLVLATLDKEKAEQAKLTVEHQIEMEEAAIDDELEQRVQKIKAGYLKRGDGFPPFDEQEVRGHLEMTGEYWKPQQSADILEVVLDKFYEGDAEILLGGASYVE